MDNRIGFLYNQYKKLRGLYGMRKGFGYRIIACLLVFMLTFAAVPQKQVHAAEDYRGWSQADSRWASLRLGSSSYTVKSSGCLVTSVTKLLIQSGLKDADDFNVGTMTKWMSNHGGFTSGGLFCWDKVTSYESKFKYYGNLLSYSSYSASSYNSKLLKWIKDGYHMVIAVKYGGHWVAVDEAKSIETGQIYIMDSASSAESSNKDIKLSSKYGTFNRVVAFKGGQIGTSATEEEQVTDTGESQEEESKEGVESVSVSGLVASEEPKAIAVGDTYTVNKMKYKVTKVLPEGGGYVTLTGTEKAKTALTSLTVKASVTIDGQTFQVKKVANKAFQGYTNLKQVTIGKNVTAIGKQAFYKCSNLKTVQVKTKVLTTVGKNAFKKVAKKISYSFPKGKVTKYKKLFA